MAAAGSSNALWLPAKAAQILPAAFLGPKQKCLAELAVELTETAMLGASSVVHSTSAIRTLLTVSIL